MKKVKHPKKLCFRGSSITIRRKRLMGQIFLIILVILGLILWVLYSVFSPVIKVFRQAFGATRNNGSREPFGREGTSDSGEHKPEGEEQSTVDLIRETNLDLEGGEYVDYEEVREPPK